MPSCYAIPLETPQATGLTALNATTGFTCAWWSKTFSTDGGIIDHYSNNSSLRNGYSVVWASGAPSVYVKSGTGFSSTSIPGFLGADSLRISRRWFHIAVTFDNATNQVRGYLNGKLVGVGTNTTDMTETTTNVTTRLFPTISGNTTALLFDIQLFVNQVVPGSDIPLLMDPQGHYQGLSARWCGLDFTTVSSPGSILDESGNGNNIPWTATTAGNRFHQMEEPPFRFTIA